jgi:exonuclease III
MNYTFRLKDGTTQIIQIIATTFKKLKVWNLFFPDGNEVMLYKMGNQWLQRTEDYLEQSYVISIGAFIDGLELN